MPIWSLTVAALIFGAGFFSGREVGIDAERRDARRRRKLRDAAHRHPSSERGNVSLDGGCLGMLAYLFVIFVAFAAVLAVTR